MNKTPKYATSLAGDIAEKKEPLEHFELIEPFKQNPKNATSLTGDIAEKIETS